MDESPVLVLTEDMIATIRSAAKKLTGFARRQFQAEVATRYCGGQANRAERVFGWGREAVQTGLHEARTGIRCLEAFNCRGRHKTEADSPKLAAEIREIVEPTAQADPKFQTTLAYTRITASKVREALLRRDPQRQDVPTRQTVGEILNRLGYRLRRVLKAKPQKKCRKPTRFSRMSKRSASGPRPTTPA